MLSHCSSLLANSGRVLTACQQAVCPVCLPPAMETLRQGRRQSRKNMKLKEISIQYLEPDGNNEIFFIIHYYDEWKMTLVFTPPSFE